MPDTINLPARRDPVPTTGRRHLPPTKWMLRQRNAGNLARSRALEPDDRKRFYVPIPAKYAIAMVLSLEWAEQFDGDLAAAICERARHWFGNDRDCQAWEPGGDEFLSPTLIEALCMSRVLPEPEFVSWFGAFLPKLDLGEPTTLFSPAMVSDRSDGKIAHLDGLNLSRAWCWMSLAPMLPAEEAQLAYQTAEAHLETAMAHVAGDYMGEHWLASFALLALLANDT